MPSESASSRYIAPTFFGIRFTALYQWWLRVIAVGSVRYLLVLTCNFLFSLEAALSEYGIATIAVSLKTTPVGASAFLFCYFLAASVGVSAAPWISHRVRPDRALLVTFGLAATVALLGSRSGNEAEFTLARIGIGLLQANMVVLLGTLIVRDAQPQERADIFSATGVGIGLGYFAAPFALAAALHWGGGWRHAYIAVGLGLMLLLPVFWRMQSQPRPSGAGSETPAVDFFDLLSIVCLSGVLGCGAMLLHPSSPLSGGLWYLIWTGLCAISLWGVFWTSNRCDSPALDVQLIRHGGCGSYLLACLLSFFATYLVAFVAPYLALSLTSAGANMGVLLLVAFPIGFALGSGVAGRVAAYLSPGWLAVWSHIGCAVTSLAGAFLILLDSPVGLTVAYLTSGAMRGATIAPMSTLATLQAPVYRLPSLLSTTSVFRSVGMLTGVAVAAHVWRLRGLDVVMATDITREIAHAKVAGFGAMVYALAAGLQTLAALLLLRYRRLN